jgi:DNA polymerase-3 subunit delta'
MNFLTADELPWLAGPQARIRAAAAGGRLPHSLLLLSPGGLGVDHLATWIAAFALCDAVAAGPCGHCASCTLLRADNHPDIHLVKIADDAQQIKVDQVRDLIDVLALKSYRGGYKVGIIEGAEALNVNGANAFLKTLEEPMQNTMLILTAKPTNRLPATVASRCLRLHIVPPSAEIANAWLARHGPKCANWAPALALAGGAPLLAADLQTAGLDAIDADMRQSLRQLAEGGIDVTLLAEQWMRSDPTLRVVWLENWITSRITRELGAAPQSKTAEPVGLPGALLKPKIRDLFKLLDAARQFRRSTATGINQQLALEALLLGGRSALGK